ACLRLPESQDPPLALARILAARRSRLAVQRLYDPHISLLVTLEIRTDRRGFSMPVPIPSMHSFGDSGEAASALPRPGALAQSAGELVSFDHHLLPRDCAALPRTEGHSRAQLKSHSSSSDSRDLAIMSKLHRHETFRADQSQYDKHETPSEIFAGVGFGN